MLSVYSMFSTVLKSQCPKCFRFRTYVTRKRFYRCTGIIQNENKWEVTLDQRRLKTPNGRILMVNSEPLAHAIAAEWDAQKDTIGQPTMHLEEELRSLQEKKWTPVIDWFQKKFGVTQEISKGLEPSPVTTETRAVLARYFLSYDFAALNAICFGVEALKSPLLMLACIERHLEPREAVLLARLEEEFQLMRWGRVPWAHELNQAELSSRVAAALLVIQCSTEKHTTTVKTPVNEQAVN
ncbi:ATP synthase mitochondrial F1 complex assembly factor 2 isoform X2 [Achroia grisella]|uniref:ATP synthase mitochondrial F1 complex assembly factor 2 isoform X2 n=1 Tax=Achroia grisella TaxID=688607 RepID=UPI0027D23B0F|nr:ATP synthase mitochondrial F1 complex assembly factor 2 isoform X2 [Achroia grisella]